MKLKNIYEEIKKSSERKGTKTIMKDMSDKANQEQYEETNIVKLIEKYGILALESKMQAKEPLFLNNIGENLTLNQRLQNDKQIKEYFESQPAHVRKQFADDYKVLQNSIATGDYEKILKNNIMTKEYTEKLENIKKERDKKYIEEINNLKNQLNERTKNEDSI